MRISDWSQTCALPISSQEGLRPPRAIVSSRISLSGLFRTSRRARISERLRPAAVRSQETITGSIGSRIPAETLDRTEEHTSELQSLMRTSYAGFCLQIQIHITCTKKPNLQKHN